MENFPKILLIGHARHGKDTVAELLADLAGIKFQGSSMAAAEIFIYDQLKGKYGYLKFEECFEDRVNHRKEWHDLISWYNEEDKAKLAKGILEKSDMYVGMRSDVEIAKCIEDDLFDIIIGVFDPNKPLEAKESFNIDMWNESDIVIPTGDIKLTEQKVVKLHKLLKSFKANL